MPVSPGIPYTEVLIDLLCEAAPRFWGRVDRSEHADSCWKWTGTCTSRGYGTFWLGGRYLGAHRVMHLLLLGPLETGKVVRHTCYTKECVNPNHLKQGTYRQNWLDERERYIMEPLGESSSPCDTELAAWDAFWEEFLPPLEHS